MRDGDDQDSVDAPRQWWERRPFLLALILLAAVPLLYPEVPPLVDLPGHMGRYRVQLDLSSSPWLHRYYGFEWAPIGNLGVDLLVTPLGRLIGLEPAVKLITLTIPPLTVAGFLWVAREVHHRLPPTALFALPFALSHPFLFGFLNFALSMALAFIFFGLWLNLARKDRTRLRAVLFVPISVLVFFTHTFGWGTLGLLCFSAEAVRQHDRGAGWFKSGWRAGWHAATMALPLVIMLAWRSETHGGMTHSWFEWERKFEWIYSSLRDRWMEFDIGSLAIVGAVLLLALFSRALTFSRNLAFSALVLFAAFLLLPWTVFGSAYADMRLAPYFIAVAVLAVRFRKSAPRTARVLAAAGLALYAVRIVGTTVSLAMAWNDQQAKLEALTHVPMGARVVSLTGYPCGKVWALRRNTHLPGMVIVRRHGFSNDQWVIEGANLLQLRFGEAGPFRADPSQMARPMGCNMRGWTIDRALAHVRRGRFDYLWLIDPPPFDPRLVEGHRPVWRNGRSILYRLQP